MIGKEDDHYPQGREFFAGKPVYWLFVNSVLNYASHMASSENALASDKAMLEAYEEDRITPELIQGYLVARRIVIKEIRVNLQGDIEFSISQVKTFRARPEPDF